MRRVSYVQIIVLILCLGITGVLVYVRPISSTATVKTVSLETELLQLSDKYKISTSGLSSRIIAALELDDYVFQTYTRNGVAVSLYIGFYFSGKKIGAAHDPQVCYPGQGWSLSNDSTGSYLLKNGEIVNYSSVFAELEDKKELVFYWFQIDDKTTSNTFSQKLLLLQKKFSHEDENNAFIRISTSLNGSSPATARSLVLEFIEDFYPRLTSYVNSK